MPASVKHLDKTGGVTIVEKNWPDAIAGEIITAEKFGVENDGDRKLLGLVLTIEQVGANDGNSFFRQGADASGTLTAPFGVTAVLTGAGAGGVWSGTGIRSYRITATNATGETVGSVEVSINVDDTTKKVQLDWTQVVGATGYKVYRTTTPGSYPDPSLRVTIGSGSTVQFIDDGTAVSTGALPADNTTAGGGPDYGTPPTLGTGAINVGDLEIGEQFFYWINRVVPGGSSEAGNPRLMQLKFTET